MGSFDVQKEVIELDQHRMYHSFSFGFIISFICMYINNCILAEGAAIQASLQKLTGQRTVPNIFINGKHIGGSDGMQYVLFTHKRNKRKEKKKKETIIDIWKVESNYFF